MSPGPHSKVHQSILREVLTPAQRTPEILEPEGELGACDTLAREKKEVQVRGRGWERFEKEDLERILNRVVEESRGDIPGGPVVKIPRFQ